MTPRKPVPSLAAFPLRDRRRTLDHPYLISAVDQLQLFCDTPDDAAFAALVGPTGSGKSHIAQALAEQMVEQARDEMTKDLQYMPAIYCGLELFTPQKHYNWTDVFMRLLKAAGHINPVSKDLAEARKKWRTTLESRRTKVVFLDEGAHLISGFKPDDTAGIKAQANIVKSLVDGTDAKLVLVSSYDIAPLLTREAQLIRRNHKIHLRRYRNSPAEREAFRVVLENADEDFKGYFDFSLAEQDAVLYEGCIGLIGVLRQWLVRASTRAKTAGTISLEALAATRLDFTDLLRMLEDIRGKEKEFYDTQETVNDFAAALEAERQMLERTSIGGKRSARKSA